MATTEVLQARLDAAETALDKLMTGQSAVSLEYDGKKKMFKAADAGLLRGYIRELQVQLGIKPARAHATSVWF